MWICRGCDTQNETAELYCIVCGWLRPDKSSEGLPRTLDEKEFWDTVCQKHTLTAYNDYIRKFPDGACLLQANNAIRTIREKKAYERAIKGNSIEDCMSFRSTYPHSCYIPKINAKLKQVEKNQWNIAESINTQQSYREFLELFPKGSYANEAKRRISAFEEDEMWKKAGLFKSIDLFESYLSRYPSGKHKQDAQQKITELTAREDVAWETARTQGTKDALLKYLCDYPQGKHKNDAESSIGKMLERDADDNDWDRAKYFDRLVFYRSYLKKHPSGKHRGEAQQKITELTAGEEVVAWETARTEGTKDALQKYLSEYPQGKHKNDAESSIRKILEREADDKDWERAIESNTKEFYQSYISKHPNGKYVHEAQRKLETFKRSRTPAIVCWIIAVCIVSAAIILNFSGSSSSTYSLPSSSSTQQAMPSNCPVKTSTLTPQEVRDLEKSTEKLITGMETAKAVGDVIHRQSKSKAYSNLRKLKDTGSSKYQSLKKRYDAL